MTGVHYAHRRRLDQNPGLHYSDFRARAARKCLNDYDAPRASGLESRLNPRRRVNAAIVQRPDELGCIREGAFADLLIVDGNPLEDLSLLYAKPGGVRQIYKNGRLAESRNH